MRPVVHAADRRAPDCSAAAIVPVVVNAVSALVWEDVAD